MTSTRKVTAGGGILVRLSGSVPEILLIYRRGAWDLPKGKAKSGESIDDCATREVSEELGIADVTIVRPLGTTRHRYTEDGTHIDKKTTWFLMRSGASEFIPQAEEGIDAVRWVSLEDALGLLTFDTLRDLVARNMDLLATASS